MNQAINPIPAANYHTTAALHYTGDMTPITHSLGL